MIRNYKFILALALAAAILPASAAAQANKSAAKGSAARQWRRECLLEGASCLEAPATWRKLTTDNKAMLQFVENDAERKPEQLAQMTIVEFELPESKDKQPLTAEELIALILPSMVKSSSAETVERGRLMVGGKSCETLAIRTHAAEGVRIERIALVDLGEGKFFVVALTSTPEASEKMRAVFQRALETLQFADDDAA